MIRAALFDLDGTLVEQAPDDTASARAMACIYREHGFDVSWTALLDFWRGGRDPLDSISKRVHQPFGPTRSPWDHLEALLGAPVGDDTRSRLVPLMVEVAMHGSPCQAMEGAVDCVATARRLGLRVAVVTGSSQEWARAALARVASSDAIDYIAAGHDVRMNKPAPDVYVHALDMLGVEPKEALAFEDSPTGLAAATAAGIRCVVIPSERYRGEEFGGAALVASSLTELAFDRLLAEIGTESPT